MKSDYTYLFNINTSQTQQEFEDDMLSVEEHIGKTQCPKCGKITVDEITVDSCDEVSCEFESLGEIFYSPGYQELMFDDEGRRIKNFLGKRK